MSIFFVDILPYFPLPESTPVQNHIINPFLKIFFVLSFTLCTQNMYSQLLKCHKIPPYERKSFRVFETIMTEVGFICGVTLECFGRFLCRIELHIAQVLKQCSSAVISIKSSGADPSSRTHIVDPQVGGRFRTYYMLGLRNGGSVTSVMKRLLDNTGLDTFLT